MNILELDQLEHITDKGEWGQAMGASHRRFCEHTRIAVLDRSMYQLGIG